MKMSCRLCTLSFLMIIISFFASTEKGSAQHFYYSYGPRPKISFLGLSVSHYRDTTFAKGNFDIGILPFEIRTESEHNFLEVSQKLALMYGIRKDEKNYLSSIMYETAFNIFFKERDEYFEGFYVAPHFQIYIMNTFRDIWNTQLRFRLGVQPGYQILINETYALSAGIHGGAMLYPKLDGPARAWKPYFGINLVFGSYFDPI